MTAEDLGQEATDLVSLSNGEAKSLSKLAELAVRQVPLLARRQAESLARQQGLRLPSRPRRRPHQFSVSATGCRCSN